MSITNVSLRMVVFLGSKLEGWYGMGSTLGHVHKCLSLKKEKSSEANIVYLNIWLSLNAGLMDFWFSFCACGSFSLLPFFFFFACFKYLRTKNNVNPPHLLNSTPNHKLPRGRDYAVSSSPQCSQSLGGSTNTYWPNKWKAREKCKHMTFQGNFWSR